MQLEEIIGLPHRYATVAKSAKKNLPTLLNTITFHSKKVTEIKSCVLNTNVCDKVSFTTFFSNHQIYKLNPIVSNPQNVSSTSVFSRHHNRQSKTSVCPNQLNDFCSPTLSHYYYTIR